MLEAATFTYQEIRSALYLYFEPLIWVFKTAKLEKPQNVYAQRTSSVKDDWRAWLPQDKNQFFADSVRQMEISYNMLAVSLDEVLALQQSGQILQANQALYVVPVLFDRAVTRLTMTLSALEEHSRRYRTTPNAAPLHVENFQTWKSKTLVQKRNSTAPVMQSPFTYKLSVLSELIDSLSADCFEIANKIIATKSSAAPDTLWQALDGILYDLNTCLRETIIMMKSFLIVLSRDEFQVFEKPIVVQSVKKELLTAEEIAFAGKDS